MFDFIVSGQIPGTQIEVTFQSVLAIASLLFGISIARQVTKLQNNDSNTKLEDITL